MSIEKGLQNLGLCIVFISLLFSACSKTDLISTDKDFLDCNGNPYYLDCSLGGQTVNWVNDKSEWSLISDKSSIGEVNIYTISLLEFSASQFDRRAFALTARIDNPDKPNVVFNAFDAGLKPITTSNVDDEGFSVFLKLKDGNEAYSSIGTDQTGSSIQITNRSGIKMLERIPDPYADVVVQFNVNVTNGTSVLALIGEASMRVWLPEVN